MNNKISIERIKTLALILAANILTIGSTLYYNWSLLEVAIIYWLEFIIISIFTCLKIISASSINGNTKPSAFVLFQSKIINLSITVLLSGLFGGGLYIFLIKVPNSINLINNDKSAIMLCAFAFFFSELASFYKEMKLGFYKTLLNDRHIGLVFLRILPMYIAVPLILVNETHGISYTIGQFMLALSIIAITDITLYMSNYDSKVKIVS